MTDLWSGDWFLAGLGQLSNRPGIISQIDLASNKDDRQTGTKVKNLGDPLQKTRDKHVQCKEKVNFTAIHGQHVSQFDIPFLGRCPESRVSR